MRKVPTFPYEKTSLWTLEAAVLWIVVCVLLALASFLFAKGNVLHVMDFRVFYSAGEIVRHDPSHLFDLDIQRAWQGQISPGELLPFYHPAYEALLYAPLSRLSYQTAYFVYMGWNMLLLWVCYVVAPRGDSEFVRRFPRPALFFLSFPLLLSVFAGQDSLLVLVALCLVYRCLEQHRDGVAGALLGLALFKLPIVVPLVFLLANRRGRRFLQGFLASTAIVVLLSMAVTGMSGSRDFLRLLSTSALSADRSVQGQMGMPTMSGFLYVFGARYLTAKAMVALNGSVFLAVLAGSVYLIRHVRRDATAFSVALVGAVLLAPHLYIYDYTALLIPFLLLKHRFVTLAGALWFLLLPVLCLDGFLTFFAPAAVIPISLFALCAADFLEERLHAEDLHLVAN